MKVDTIAKAACEVAGISLIALKSPQRNRRISKPRQVAMLIAKELTGRSLTQIGRYFERDHTTVLYACRVIEEKLEVFDPEISGLYHRTMELVAPNVEVISISHQDLMSVQSVQTLKQRNAA